MARDSSLKLLPRIAEKTGSRAAQVNQTLSGYIAILVWNQVQAPASLKREPDSAKDKRVHVPCYMRANISELARKIAHVAKLSVNASIEALIASDLRSGEPRLIVLPARGSIKPRLE